jgi:hypothetical protein
LAVIPGLSATLEYRFFGTGRAGVPINRVSASTGASVREPRKRRVEISFAHPSDRVGHLSAPRALLYRPE